MQKTAPLGRHSLMTVPTARQIDDDDDDGGADKRDTLLPGDGGSFC